MKNINISFLRNCSLNLSFKLNYDISKKAYFCVSVSVPFYVFFCVTLSLKWGKKQGRSKPESPVQDQQDQAVIAEDEDEFVTMAQVRELLQVQESMLKTLFFSSVWFPLLASVFFFDLDRPVVDLSWKV